MGGGRCCASQGPNGASLLQWPVSAIETLVGFVLQTASLGVQNRRLLETAQCSKKAIAGTPHHACDLRDRSPVLGLRALASTPTDLTLLNSFQLTRP